MTTGEHPAANTRARGARGGQGMKALPRIISMLVLTILVLGPLYWVTISAFKGREEIIRSVPTFWPETFTLSNFEKLFASTQYPVFLTNSLIVGVATTIVTVLISLAAAYGLYRLKVPGIMYDSSTIPAILPLPGTFSR